MVHQHNKSVRRRVATCSNVLHDNKAERSAAMRALESVQGRIMRVMQCCTITARTIEALGYVEICVQGCHEAVVVLCQYGRFGNIHHN